jgi:hypothetical protein
MKYVDLIRADIKHAETHGTPKSGTQTGLNPLEAAQVEVDAMLQFVADNPKDLGEGDKNSVRRLQCALDSLHEALDGGDVRYAALAGIAFGKALHEARSRIRDVVDFR